MNQVLDKIAKALNLGTNNSNENEAQSAILAAQRLMAKYHISQEEVNDFINDNVKLKNEYVGIIHGRSSNILRDKAHEILKLNKNVDSFKVDIFNPGMTIVKIKFRK